MTIGYFDNSTVLTFALGSLSTSAFLVILDYTSKMYTNISEFVGNVCIISQKIKDEDFLKQTLKPVPYITSNITSSDAQKTTKPIPKLIEEFDVSWGKYAPFVNMNDVPVKSHDIRSVPPNPRVNNIEVKSPG
jgi:hypothetical protein